MLRDGRTDGRTDIAASRVAFTRLITLNTYKSYIKTNTVDHLSVPQVLASTFKFSINHITMQ